MIIFDLETSNIDSGTGSVLTIGAIDFDNPEDTFYGECRLREGADINPESLKITGFSLEYIMDSIKPSTTDLIRKFLNWLSEHKDQTLAGQNPHWDLEYIKAEMKRSGITDIKLGYRIIDLHSVCTAKMMELGKEVPLKNNRTDINTETILVFCGLKERPGAHNGLEDSKLEAECFSRIIYGKNLLSEYSEFPIPEYLLKQK